MSFWKEEEPDKSVLEQMLIGGVKIQELDAPILYKLAQTTYTSSSVYLAANAEILKRIT